LDGKRIRKFDADEIVNIAVSLDVPIVALFLPPEDDGVDVRYLFDLPGESTVTSSNSRTTADLFMYLMSEPDDKRHSGKRGLTGSVTYPGLIPTSRWPGVRNLLVTLKTSRPKTALSKGLVRLRGQYDALRGLLTDIDQLQEALTDRLP